MSTNHVSLSSGSRRPLLAAILNSLILLLSVPAHAEKTISYYTENVGERLDRVLACKDGAEDPLSLGCRNANAAQETDVQLASRYQRGVELAKWRAESEPNRRQLLVLRALENVSNALMNIACVHLTDGQAPTDSFGKASLKAALEERFIEPLPGQSGKYRATARGEEMLNAQQRSSKTGYFCPVRLQYRTDFKIIDFQDLTAQNKGKKTEAGKVVKTMGIATVDMNLANTYSSVWYTKKVFPVTLPVTGLARGRYLIVEFTNSDAVVGSGGIVSVDGKVVSERKVEEQIDKYYK